MSDKKSNKETSAKMFTNPLYKPKAKGKKSEDGKYDEKYLVKRMKSFTDKQPRLSGSRPWATLLDVGKKPSLKLKPQLPVAQNKKKAAPMSASRRESLKRQVSDDKWEEWYKEWQKNPKMPPPPRGTPEDHGWSLEGVVNKPVVNKPVTTNNPMFGKDLPKRKTPREQSRGTMLSAKLKQNRPIDMRAEKEKLRQNRSIFRKKKAGKGKRRRTRKKRKRRRTKKKRKRRRKKRRRTRK